MVDSDFSWLAGLGCDQAGIERAHVDFSNSSTRHNNKMSLPTVEEVQTAILKALDASPDGKINDTRTLVVNGKELGENGQTLVKAALDSLQTKDVSALGAGIER